MSGSGSTAKLGATGSSVGDAAAGAAKSPEEREKEMMELLEKLKKAAAAPEQATRRVCTACMLHVACNDEVHGLVYAWKYGGTGPGP